jgi:addiction module HigA family antidote
MSAESRSKSGIEAARLTPGAHLRAEIERLGLDQVAVSKATGVSRQSVNNIINGRQPISRAMAGKLGRLTGRSSDYWLSDYFLATGKVRPSEEIRFISGVMVNHQIIRAVADGLIGIIPFDTGNVRAAAIDLTIGKGLTLAPRESAQSRTKERIDMPLDYVGRIGIVARLAKVGIVAAHAFQFEPGSKGQLDFNLFNVGDKPVHLRTGDTVLSLEIVRLGTTPDHKITT